MAAERIAGILPPLTLEESMEITKIYSIMGLLDEKEPLIQSRPFRSVHHTVTRAALAGGGMIPTPGEITLAHGGVLFLDELPEFSKSVIEVLRQPLEEHQHQKHYQLSGQSDADHIHESMSLRMLSGYAEMYLYACADSELFRKDQSAVSGSNRSVCRGAPGGI